MKNTIKVPINFSYMENCFVNKIIEIKYKTFWLEFHELECLSTFKSGVNDSLYWVANVEKPT